MVVIQYTGRGTNTGAGNGLPATGKSVEVTGVTIFRIKGGKIAEEWNETDMLGLLKQLGLIPSQQLAGSMPPR
jgi:predicted ester cyclase